MTGNLTRAEILDKYWLEFLESFDWAVVNIGDFKRMGLEGHLEDYFWLWYKDTHYKEGVWE